MELSILFPSDPNETDIHDTTRIHPFSLYNSSTERNREVWAIVALDSLRAIGKDGGIPWRLREDLRHFKEITMGHPVIMGRKTWESLPRRPLPGRRNIVITRNPDYSAEGAQTASSLECAIASCEPSEIPVIIGGAHIYEAALPLCTRLYVTAVELETPDADTFFPALPASEWSLAENGERMVSENGIAYRFLTYIRK